MEFGKKMVSQNPLKKIGQIYYKEKDQTAILWSRNWLYLWRNVKTNYTLLTPSYDFAYGFLLFQEKISSDPKVYRLTSKIPNSFGEDDWRKMLEW